MRTHLLTERQRKIINVFLTRGDKLEGFRSLLFRARHANITRIEEDLELIKKLLEKAEQVK